MSFISKVRARYLASIIFVSLLLFSVQVLAARKPAPDISDVLQGSRSNFDFGFVLIGFFALSLATLSVAKGYEIFSRMKDSKGRDEKSSEFEIMKEENDRLMGMGSTLQYENEVLRKDVLRLESAIREKTSQEDIIKKNELGLRKELERLLQEKARLITEKEALTLKASQSSIFEVGNHIAGLMIPKEEKGMIELEEIVIEPEVKNTIILEEIVVEAGAGKIIMLDEIVVEGKPAKKRSAVKKSARTKNKKGGKR